MAETTVPPRPSPQPGSGPQPNVSPQQAQQRAAQQRAASGTGPQQEPRPAATWDPETGTYLEPEQPEDILEARKRVAEWDWSKEPRDWSSVPTYFTPEAPPPEPRVGGYTSKSGETIAFAGTTDETRALAALKVLKNMGYTADPADLPIPPPAGATSTSLQAGMTTNRATGVRSGP